MLRVALARCGSAMINKVLAGHYLLLNHCSAKFSKSSVIKELL